MPSKIVGLWSGHDASFCVLNDGMIELHTELERHLREKEPAGDAAQMFLEHHGDFSDVTHVATSADKVVVTGLPGWKAFEDRGYVIHEVGHHEAHAAHAFYSSNYDEATILTIDGGGYERVGENTLVTISIGIWSGKGTDIELLELIPIESMNIGGIWSRVTRHVFGYESGWPQGCQAGTTMALAALAKDPDKYVSLFYDYMTRYPTRAAARAPGHVKGMSAKDPRNPKHPVLDRYRVIANSSDDERYNLAGGLQVATEKVLYELLQKAAALNPGVKNVCISGGVALNSLSMGKITQWKSPWMFTSAYVPPVPYDGGLAIGSAQYVQHMVLKQPRIVWNDNVSPYMGKSYDKSTILASFKDDDRIRVDDSDDDRVVKLLLEGKIVSVFNGRAESGRRALGNRSILADPRNPKMKDIVNEKVKHRQWFRPFAPSVCRDVVGKLFTTEQDSPYMSFVLKFKEDAAKALPAVVHFDGSARLQTVTRNDNAWYYDFIKLWGRSSGYDIVLNTSFNDREPICETPEDAFKCFMGTDIDAMYFPSEKLILTK